MPYVPKSKIAYKNTPEGHFIYKTTKQSFSGPYMSINGIKYYEGVDYINKGKELIKVSSLDLDNNNSVKRFNSHIDIRKYNNLKKNILSRLINTKPLPVVKTIPLILDYQKGYYTRYFSKRFNGKSYLEIDKITYDKLKNKSNEYDYNLYECGSITWHTNGNVFKKNALEIQKVNRIFPGVFVLFPVLNEFYQVMDINVIENLNTSGKELYFSDGKEYVGNYHLHPTKGPMVGGTHTSNPHQRLYYTNQLPNFEGLGYNDFLANYNKITCYKCINRFGKHKRIISNQRSSLLGCPANTTTDYDQAVRECFGIRDGETKARVMGDRTDLHNKFHSDPSLKRVFPLDGGAPSSKDYSGFGLWNKNNKQYGEYNNENGSCFTPNTLITMADGNEKLISLIKKGDKVKSQVGESTVLEVIIHTGSFTAYSINNSKPFVTEEHPFKTIDGWKAINPITTLEKHQIQSKTLNIDDILIKLDKNELVKNIKTSKAQYPKVYNLSLDNEHVYYANKYLVHNEKQVGLSIDDLQEMAYTTKNYSWSDFDVPNNNNFEGAQNPFKSHKTTTVNNNNTSGKTSGGSSGGSSGGGGGGY